MKQSRKSQEKPGSPFITRILSVIRDVNKLPVSGPVLDMFCVCNSVVVSGKSGVRRLYFSILVQMVIAMTYLFICSSRFKQVTNIG